MLEGDALSGILMLTPTFKPRHKPALAKIFRPAVQVEFSHEVTLTTHPMAESLLIQVSCIKQAWFQKLKYKKYRDTDKSCFWDILVLTRPYSRDAKNGQPCLKEFLERNQGKKVDTRGSEISIPARQISWLSISASSRARSSR